MGYGEKGENVMHHSVMYCYCEGESLGSVRLQGAPEGHQTVLSVCISAFLLVGAVLHPSPVRAAWLCRSSAIQQCLVECLFVLHLL